MTRVLVLGATGMLGLMVVDVLSRDRTLTVTATGRDADLLERSARAIPEVRWSHAEATGEDFARHLEGQDWVVNAIGLIKPYVHDSVMGEVEQAIRVNALFPHRLARATANVGARLLQIATDCVYSGRAGRYREGDAHDAEDVYGKTKSLGEVQAAHVVNLRCSIVGPELRAHRSLLDWFQSQPDGATLNGFTNHLWNGITTLQFGELASAIVRGADTRGLQHVIPGQHVTKAELLRVFATAFERPDIHVVDTLAAQAVDRTLATDNAEANQLLWAAAGYATPPTIPLMVERLAKYDCRLLSRIPAPVV
jgi:dTDP-4-dehydrorhamnose reductase